jgi:hypothetical protein
VSVRHGDQPAELKNIRADDADGQGRWSFSSQPGHPTATYVRLQGIGHVRVHQHRPVRGQVKTISVKGEGSRRCQVLSCDDVPAEPLPATGAAPGIVDHARKAALALIRDHDAIVHEDLPITNMTRSAAGAIQAPGRNGAPKSGPNRSILDAGSRVFLTVLARKAESAGRELIVVNPAGTSRTCARCGHCATDDRLTQAEFRCQQRGHEARADVKAATNILRAGLALRQAAEAAWREAAPFGERRSHGDSCTRS